MHTYRKPLDEPVDFDDQSFARCARIFCCLLLKLLVIIGSICFRCFHCINQLVNQVHSNSITHFLSDWTYIAHAVPSSVSQLNSNAYTIAFFFFFFGHLSPSLKRVWLMLWSICVQPQMAQSIVSPKITDFVLNSNDRNEPNPWSNLD